MTRVRFGAVVLGLALGSSAAHSANLEISQLAFRPPNLLVFVDRGESPPPLSARVKEDGRVAWGATKLSVQQAGRWNPASGVSVVVAVDVSASMKSADFPAIQRALGAALSTLPGPSKAALLTIGSTISVPVPFGAVDAVRAAVDGLAPDTPNTALNHGVLRAQALAMEERADLPLRRFVLLVTDGMDDDKKEIGSSEMLTQVQNGEVPIFMAAVPSKTRAQQGGLQALGHVARASGGDFVRSSPERLAHDLRGLLAQAMRVDVLTVECKQCVRDGEARVLQVVLPQGGGTVSGVRTFRLVDPVAAAASAVVPRASEPVPPAPTPAREAPPAPRLSLIEQIKIKVELILPWRFFLALLGLFVPALFVGGYVYRQPIRHFFIAVFRSAKTEEPSSVIETEGHTVSRKPDGKTQQLTINVAGGEKKHILVGANPVVMGRSSKSDIVAEKDKEASNRHAELYMDKGKLMLRDLGSENGTELNGTPIVQPEPVPDHAMVRIGRTEIRIYFGKL